MSKTKNEPITLDALPPGSVVELQGKQYPTHPGLLALAHAHGLESITTELLQYSDGEAIIKATATGTRGIYEAHGDASPSNVSRNIANAVIRMAETRAVNRCLRLYLGIGATTAEELPPDAFQGSSGGNTRRAPSKPRQSKPRAANETYHKPNFADLNSAVESLVGVPTECPKCGGRIWDNRDHKKANPNSKRPWFSCRDRDGCGWATWDAPQQSQASARPVEPNYPVFDDESVASTTIGVHPDDEIPF